MWGCDGGDTGAWKIRFRGGPLHLSVVRIASSGGSRRAHFSNGAGCDVFAEIVHRKRRWRDCVWTCVAASLGVYGFVDMCVIFRYVWGVQWRTVVKTWRVRREIACVPTHGEGGNSRRTVCARGLLGEVCVLCRLALTMMKVSLLRNTRDDFGNWNRSETSILGFTRDLRIPLCAYSHHPSPMSRRAKRVRVCVCGSAQRHEPERARMCVMLCLTTERTSRGYDGPQEFQGARGAGRRG